MVPFPPGHKFLFIGLSAYKIKVPAFNPNFTNRQIFHYAYKQKFILKK